MDSSATSSSKRSEARSRSGSASLLPPSSTPRRPLPDACCASPRWSWCGCAAVMWLVAEQARVEAAQVGLLLVPPLPPPMKSSPGHAWLAARALPRHAGQVSTWAFG
jgi:hypothetical protein